jgi:adenylate cyclase
VFLSYARADANVASKLADALQALGHEVWWDRHVRGGVRYAEEIDRALSGSEAVVVLWSPSSIASTWVLDEAQEGRDAGKLIPAIIDACKPPLGYRQYETVDLSSWNGGLVPEKLLNAIAAVPITSAEKPLVHPAVPSNRLSICVLPFENMSGDAEQEYFSDGITEDIITDLSKYSALAVTARNTAFAFKGKSVDVTDVARKLAVSHVLGGSVRKAGNRIRITAQLIDGLTGDYLWRDRFDRDLANIFGIQDDISKSIVDALELKLLPKEKSDTHKRGTSNVEAYNLYLMARHEWINGVYGDIRTDQAIVRLCREAVELDPNYAQAWALMALAQTQLRFWHGTSDDALPAAERALVLDSNIAEAYCVRSRYLEEQGRNVDAATEIATALRLEPESWEVNRAAGRLSFRNGRITEAIAFFEKTTALMSSDFYGPEMLVTCYRSIGEGQLAERAARLVIERCNAALVSDPGNAGALAAGAAALLVCGQKQRAMEWLDAALLLKPDNVAVLYNLACTYAGEANDPERALQILERVFDRLTGITMLKHIEIDPDFKSIRQRPRFRKLLASARKRLAAQAMP